MKIGRLMVNSVSLPSWKKDVVFCFSYNVAQAIDTLYYPEGQFKLWLFAFCLRNLSTEKELDHQPASPFSLKNGKRKETKQSKRLK